MNLSFDLGAALALVGFVGFWLRMERRLTRIETKLEDLPCTGRKPGPDLDCGYD